MKTTKTTITNVETTSIIAMICNKCGKQEDGENIDNWSTIETWQHNFGYGSRFDTDTIEFELCDGCYQEFIDTFKQPPTIINQSL